jgi:hypothetical protein
MEQQQYTSVHQSRKLLEIGISPDTAENSHNIVEKFSGNKLPKWTVQELLDLLPQAIITDQWTSDEVVYHFNLSKFRDENGYRKYLLLYESEHSPAIIRMEYETIIECAYNALVALSEIKSYNIK